MICPCCGADFDEAWKTRDGLYCSPICKAAYVEDVELYLGLKKEQQEDARRAAEEEQLKQAQGAEDELFGLASAIVRGLL